MLVIVLAPDINMHDVICRDVIELPLRLMVNKNVSVCEVPYRDENNSFIPGYLTPMAE